VPTLETDKNISTETTDRGVVWGWGLAIAAAASGAAE